MSFKWIITGLGNPGIKYAETRHNIGFQVVTFLSREYGVSLTKDMFYESGEGLIGGEKVLLVKPLTFMNRSGEAIRYLLNKIKDDDSRLIVVHDDIDLQTGIVRIRKKGSFGGHKGVESIIQELSTEDFIRVKVGIGRSLDVPVERHVLDRFDPFEENIIKDAIIEAASAVVKIITQGVELAMNEINRPKKQLEPD